VLTESVASIHGLELVAEHVGGAIEASPGTASFRLLLRQLMQRPGRILTPGGSAKWPRFVLETCAALSGVEEHALPGAAAVEFIVAAIDVTDDLVDDDWASQPYRRERALNAALALQLLGQLCAASLATGLGPDRAFLIGRVIIRNGLASCAGQDLDIELEETCDVSEELAHDMTRGKSGSLVAMACQVGAMIATQDPAVHKLVCPASQRSRHPESGS
jgi:geranylgeranyl pyrophosphate synthase